MDYSDIISYAVTLILGVGVIATFIKSNKWFKVAVEVVDTLNTILASIKDGDLTKEEVLKIKADIKEVIDLIKS